MFFITGRKRELQESHFRALGHYRHEVFVNRLGWKMQLNSDIELDEFDGPDAIYVSSRNEYGQVNGMARLLPTTAPYLLGSVFPDLWDGSELPHRTDVWEISRFAAVDLSSRVSPTNQASAGHAAILFRQAVQIAIKHGARTLISVSPVGMERMLKLNGYCAVRAGTPRVIDHCSVVALKIDLANSAKEK